MPGSSLKWPQQEKELAIECLNNNKNTHNSKQQQQLPKGLSINSLITTSKKILYSKKDSVAMCLFLSACLLLHLCQNVFTSNLGN